MTFWLVCLILVILVFVVDTAIVTRRGRQLQTKAKPSPRRITPSQARAQNLALRGIYDTLNGRGWNGRGLRGPLCRLAQQMPTWLSSNSSVIADPCPLMKPVVECELSNSGFVDYLDFSGCNLRGQITNQFAPFTKLTNLRLNDNPLLLGNLSWFGNLPPSLLELNINNNIGSNGPLPSNIAGLRSLTEFQAFNCRLTGTLPDLSTLRNLDTLMISNNSFTGTLSPALGSLAALRLLTFGQNSFSGSLPSTFGRLMRLRILGAAQNSLSGTIATEFGRLTGLTMFDVSRNNLHGPVPQALFNMPALAQLLLNGNRRLGGTLPLSATCRSLVSLDLSQNLFTGPIPSWIANNVRLTNLALWENRFTSSLPSSLGNLRLLTSLRIETNALRGTLPTELSALGNLARFLALKNCFSGTLPSQYSLLTSLTLFSLQSPNCPGVSGTIPASWSNLRRLQSLILAFNQLTGNIPQSFGALVALTNMEFSSNRLGLGTTLPSSLGQLTRLQAFAIQNNSYAGPLPSFLGTMTALRIINVAANRFSSTLPAFLGALTNLSTLWIHTNSFSGSVPQSYASLPISRFIARRNKLSGSLSFLRRWTSLAFLSIEGNQFTSTIPSELATFTGLRIFYVQDNKLVGPLPLLSSRMLRGINVSNNALTGPAISPAVVSLSSLQYLDLSYNKLQSFLPTQLCSLSQLIYLFVQFNRITGSLPSQFGSGCMSNLTSLRAEGNLLVGTLPPRLSGLQSLQKLGLSRNFLKGSIPAQFGSWTNMQSLSLDFNMLTSTIPSALFSGLGASLATLRINDNRINGTLPESLSQLTCIQVFLAHNNKISGTIPTRLSPLSSLRRFFVSNNSLVGTIPSSLGQSKLSHAGFSINSLWGSIPSSFSALPLQYLDVHDNMLTNRGSGFAFLKLSGSSSSGLQYLDLSSNELSGTIPESIFLLPNLTNLVLAANCLSGRLSPTNLVCSATKLQALVLDGLSASNACRTKIWGDNKLGLTGIVSRPMEGSVPSCVFTLPKLSLLHISGNGFSGTLPEKISPGLSDLALSNNRFSGSIASSLQQQFPQLVRLDLSSNKFNGTIDSTTQPPKQVLDLKINRFSGMLGAAIIAMGTGSAPLNAPTSSPNANATKTVVQKVDVLAGNSFDCTSPASGFPKADPWIDNSLCGSASANGYAYSFVAIFFAVLALYILTESPKRHASVSFFDFFWVNVEANEDDVTALEGGGHGDEEQKRAFAVAQTMTMFLSELRGLRKTSVILALVAVFAAFPVYGIASINASTQADPYIWRFSAALKAGISAAVADITVQLIFSVVFVACLSVYFAGVRRKPGGEPSSPSSSRDRRRESLRESRSSFAATASTKSTETILGMLALRMFLLFTLNLALTVGVNVAFVYIMNTADSQGQTAATVGLSVFNCLWDIDKLTKIKALFWGITEEDLRRARRASPWANRLRGGFAFKFLLGMIKAIGAPCLASVVSSPSCFLQYFFAPAPLISSYSQTFCDTNDIDTVLPGIVTGGGTNFAFLMTQTTATTCTTLENSATVQSPFLYNFYCSSTILMSFVPPMMLGALMDAFVAPALIWAIRKLLSSEAYRAKLPGAAVKILYGMLPPLALTASERLRIIHFPPDAQPQLQHQPTKKTKEPEEKMLVDVEGLLVKLLERFGIALSFGSLFPMLLFMIMVSVFTTATLQYKLVANFASCPVVEGENELLLRNLQPLSDLEAHPVYSARWMLLMIATTFAAFFAYDSAADVAEHSSAVGLAVAAALCPLLAATALELIYSNFLRARERHRDSEREKESSRRSSLRAAAAQEGGLASASWTRISGALSNAPRPVRLSIRRGSVEVHHTSL